MSEANVSAAGSQQTLVPVATRKARLVLSNTALCTFQPIKKVFYTPIEKSI
jgi:hypothetical protein